MLEIICNIKLGELKQDLYIKNQNIILQKFSLALDEIPDFIAKRKDIQNVYLTGTTQNFLRNIELSARQIENNLFSQDTKNFIYI